MRRIEVTARKGGSNRFISSDILVRLIFESKVFYNGCKWQFSEIIKNN